MRHGKAGFKLGRITQHRWALFRNLLVALFRHERIMTTEAKAKAIRGLADHMVTLAKREDLHARRQALAMMPDETVVKKLFDDLGARYASRPGGYTRILRLGPRRGDGAEMAIVELLGSEYKPEKPEEKGKKAETEKKAESKPAAKAASGKAKAAKAKAKGEDKPEGGGKKKAAAKGKKKGADKEAE